MKPSSMSMFGRAVLAHRAQLDQVRVRRVVAHRPQQLERADDVAVLGDDGVVDAAHRPRRARLLAVVDDRVGLEVDARRQRRTCPRPGRRRTAGSACRRPRARPRCARRARRSASASRRPPRRPSAGGRSCRRRRHRGPCPRTAWPSASPDSRLRRGSRLACASSPYVVCVSVRPLRPRAYDIPNAIDGGR